MGLSGLRVLIVDDSALTQQLVADAVRASGVPIHRLLVARDAGEAKRVIEATRVDVLLTNVHMTAVDSAALAVEMTRKAKRSHVRVVVLTIGVPDTNKSNTTTLGVHAYLTKPFRFDAIRALLTDVYASASRRPLGGSQTRKSHDGEEK